MISYYAGLFLFLSSFFRSRSNLSLEIVALHQQLSVLNRKRPRPRLRIGDRLFWVLLHRLWSGWENALILVKPETVVAWHRAGFSLFWRFRSRSKNCGRPKLSAEIRSAIKQMVEENHILLPVLFHYPGSAAGIIARTGSRLPEAVFLLLQKDVSSQKRHFCSGCNTADFSWNQSHISARTGSG
jgi:hypothetical protein